MSRFYDHIMRQGVIGNSDWTAIWREIHRRLMPYTTVVDINNVAQYLYGLDLDWTPEEFYKTFPILAPPFSHAFLEYKVAGNVDLMLGNWRRVFGDLSIGLFMGATTSDHKEFHEEIERWAQYERRITGMSAPTAFYDAKWCVGIFGIIGYKAKAYVGVPIGKLTIFLDEHGQAVPCADGPAGFYEQTKLVEEAEWVRSFALHAFSPALMAISFMHCKNVTTALHDPPIRASRKHQINYGYPLTLYYTLNIQPMKEVLTTEGKVEETGIKKALHICRGHFARYTPDKPLFGKYSGTFWRPHHVRGSKAHGEVVKDYSIKAPR